MRKELFESFPFVFQAFCSGGLFLIKNRKDETFPDGFQANHSICCEILHVY